MTFIGAGCGPLDGDLGALVALVSWHGSLIWDLMGENASRLIET
jgi:hypothetical protein